MLEINPLCNDTQEWRHQFLCPTYKQRFVSCWRLCKVVLSLLFRGKAEFSYNTGDRQLTTIRSFYELQQLLHIASEMNTIYREGIDEIEQITTDVPDPKTRIINEIERIRRAVS